MQDMLKEDINKIVQITAEEFAEIELFFQRKSRRKGSVLVESGKTGSHEYFILKGLVAASHLNEMGKNQIVQFAMEGQWISDIQSFNTGCASLMDIKCLEDTELYRISYQDKEKLCAMSNKMGHFFRKKSYASSILLQNTILLFMCSNAKERYQHFIKAYPDIHLRIPKVMIASFLGITRRTLSQI